MLLNVHWPGLIRSATLEGPTRHDNNLHASRIVLKQITQCRMVLAEGHRHQWKMNERKRKQV